MDISEPGLNQSNRSWLTLDMKLAFLMGLRGIEPPTHGVG